MADNVQLNENTTPGAIVRTEQIGGAQYQVVKIAIGNTDVSDGDISATNPMPVTGALTDTQLRANPVPISGTVSANTGLSQPLTDAQLRATPVPISGTVNASTGLSQPLTDTQLRAAAVPVSIATPALPLTNKVTVTTAANRVQLSSGLAVKSVTIKAGLSNTGIIYVGDSTVSSSNGFELAAGDSVSMDIANLNTIYIDASANSQYVTYFAVN